MRDKEQIPSLRLGKNHPNKRAAHPFAEPQHSEGRTMRRAKRRLAARVKAWPTDGKSHTGLAMHKPGSLKKS